MTLNSQESTGSNKTMFQTDVKGDKWQWFTMSIQVFLLQQFKQCPGTVAGTCGCFLYKMCVEGAQSHKGLQVWKLAAWRHPGRPRHLQAVLRNTAATANCLWYGLVTLCGTLQESPWLVFSHRSRGVSVMFSSCNCQIADASELSQYWMWHPNSLQATHGDALYIQNHHDMFSILRYWQEITSANHQIITLKKHD